MSVSCVGKAPCEFLFKELRHARELGPVAQAVGDSRPGFRYRMLSTSLNRGPLFLAAIEAVKGNITGQIAVKISLDAMVDTVLDVTPRLPKERGAALMIQSAFREANQRVYDYGHRMVAGGKISATGIIAAFDGDRVSIGRAGTYESFLWRDGKLLRFFSDPAESRAKGGVSDRYIGANPQILVDVASVTLKDDDLVVITTLPDVRSMELIGQILEEEAELPELLEGLVMETGKSALLRQSGAIQLDRNIFFAALRWGMPPIVLQQVVGQ